MPGTSSQGSYIRDRFTVNVRGIRDSWNCRSPFLLTEAEISHMAYGPLHESTAKALSFERVQVRNSWPTARPTIAGDALRRFVMRTRWCRSSCPKAGRANKDERMLWKVNSSSPFSLGREQIKTAIKAYPQTYSPRARLQFVPRPSPAPSLPSKIRHSNQRGILRSMRAHSFQFVSNILIASVDVE